MKNKMCVFVVLGAALGLVGCGDSHSNEPYAHLTAEQVREGQIACANLGMSTHVEDYAGVPIQLSCGPVRMPDNGGAK